MSLINQVLKDLERRREEPGLSNTGSFITTPRYMVARGSSATILYVFAAILLVLSLAIGFLFWERVSEIELPLLMTLGQTPPAPAVTFRPIDAEPASATTKPPVEGTIVGLVTADKTEHKVDKIEKIKPANKDLETNINSRMVFDEVDHDESNDSTVDGSIEKQPRQLTRKQRAEQAFHKAYAILKQGDVSHSEDLFRELLRQHPRYIRSREMLAGIYIKAGRYVEAAELLEQGVNINPQHSMFRKLYARVLLEQDGLDKAVRVLEQKLPPIAQHVDYYALLAALYQRQGRHKNAVALYQNMLKENAMVGIWWIGLGISQEKLGESVAARQAYEKARASGTLAVEMIQYADNRLTALKEIGFPEE
ncbi:hypothetical protein MNBD_GAMMA25-1131 [hydrothermal vent metagenome]|uniref:Uncharacterized protein n=1 Tax=hydrothermal vent metagenome TaxID=652676 RepID=A0A3B1B1A6_9ZZZZ